jgi:hypothetical protein
MVDEYEKLSFRTGDQFDYIHFWQGILEILFSSTAGQVFPNSDAVVCWP